MTITQPEEHLDVRLVVHTHWDREWYRPFSRFRSRLVALIDEILEGVAGSPFLLDGQAVVLEDYLEVRPERSADVSTALRQGAIEAGPWYVLADALIPSGEGLVRNLLAGRRVLRSLRAIAPNVLYCPDSFGHPATLPSIALGFGCPVIVLWRGYGGISHPPGDSIFWKAPDEATALVYHLPPDGYEFGSHLPAEADTARERWRSMREVLAPRATTGLVLLTVGADHHAPPVNLLQALDALKTVARPDQVSRVSLGEFGRALFERVHNRPLPTARGELRDSYGYTWTLQGTFSSRAALKRRYAQTELLLLRDVEPWAALARWHGDTVDRRALLRTAWKPVLLCQPHDTLCGCSVDEVATAMAARLDEAESSAVELRDASIRSLLKQDGNEARRAPAQWEATVVVRNAAPRLRSGVAELEVDLVLDDAPVGPASAGIEPRHRTTGPLSIGSPPVAVQEIARERAFAREEASRHYPWNRLIERRRVLAWVTGVPAYGLLALPIEEKRRRITAPSSQVKGANRRVEGNGMVIEAGDDVVSLTSRDHRIADWIRFEVEGERGDLYTRSAIDGTRRQGTLVRSRVTARGPLRAELTCDWRISVPARILTTAAGEPRRAAATRLDVQTVIQLDAGSPFTRVRVTGVNAATDMRLRVGFDTGMDSPRVVADAAFGPVTRGPILPPAQTKETAPPTAPLHRYVSLFSAGSGATLFSDGLAEYESADGVVWVTMIRAVGELSRHDLPERPGHAGYPVPTPGAQGIGPFEASFAFTTHGPASDETAAHIERMADDVLLPLRGDTLRTAIDPPGSVLGVALAGDGLACSTIKQSEDGEWTVLRCVNVTERAVAGSWALPGGREAMMASLDETPVEGMRVVEERVEFQAPPRGIVTILVR